VNIEQAIASLGDTIDNVFYTLQSAGVKGERGEATSCPIAKYLGAIYPAFMQVCESHVTVAGSRIHTYPFPDHISEWIRRFDAGYYPEFVA
jgi:hypothetical protein